MRRSCTSVEGKASRSHPNTRFSSDLLIGGSFENGRIRDSLQLGDEQVSQSQTKISDLLYWFGGADLISGWLRLGVKHIFKVFP